MADALILYSVNTLLAYRIAQKYYGGRHYVWCAPYFNRPIDSPRAHALPPSSVPAEIYKNLLEAIKSGDRHCAAIANNKVGLRRGAIKKREAGIIDDQQLQDINWVIDEAEAGDFAPLLYVIPFAETVSSLAHEVPVQDKAHPFSEEYLIEALPHNLFNVIEF